MLKTARRIISLTASSKIQPAPTKLRTKGKVWPLGTEGFPVDVHSLTGEAQRAAVKATGCPRQDPREPRVQDPEGTVDQGERKLTWDTVVRDSPLPQV